MVTTVHLEFFSAGRAFPVPGLPVHIPCGGMYPRHCRPGKAKGVDCWGLLSLWHDERCLGCHAGCNVFRKRLLLLCRTILVLFAGMSNIFWTVHSKVEHGALSKACQRERSGCFCARLRLQAASELVEKYRGDALPDRKLLPHAGAMACEYSTFLA